MKRKSYIQPYICFEPIDTDNVLTTYSEGLNTNNNGAGNGDGGDDYAKRSDFIFDESEDWSSQNTFEE